MNQPIPWYIAGPLIGLTLPALLIIGNKTFGISSSMRHICASCVPGDISFFNYNWKKNKSLSDITGGSTKTKPQQVTA